MINPHHAFPDVLVVDSRSVSRTVLRMVLTLAGFHVRCVSGGVAALAAIRYDPPDLILLETAPRDMDGGHLYAVLSDGADTHDIPVLLVSSSSESSACRFVDELGVEAFLTGPVENEHLRDEILHRIDWTAPTECDGENTSESVDRVVS